MGSRFYFGGSDDYSDNSGSDFDGDNSSLPFPKPLSRSSFLEPDFDPTTFLANLSDRYQTLEDLRNELRELSQSLSKELLDLVNDNYQDFLSLGSILQGGEERIEEIRVGLLSFQRDLKSVRDNVKQRRGDVAALIDEKTRLASEAQDGKSLLEIGEQIEDLEVSLMIGTSTETPEGMEGQEFSDESDADVEDGGMSIHRLERHVEQYLILGLLIRRHKPSHPYIMAQSDRIFRIKSTISLDLEGALKHFQSLRRARPDDLSPIDRLTELARVLNETQPAQAQ